jgi:hypothetical protein
VNCRVDRVQDLGHVQLPCKCTFDSCVMINQTSGFCFTVLSVLNEKFGFWFGFFFPPISRYPRLCVRFSRLVYAFFLKCHALRFRIFFSPTLQCETLCSFFLCRLYFFPLLALMM